MVLRPSEDGWMGRMLRWVTATHTQRYHAHYHTSGEGHLYQSRFKSFPIADDDGDHFLIVCRYVERNPLRANLVERAKDWRFGSLWRWAQQAERLPKLLAPWPIPRTPNWIERVNQPLPEKELKALRDCVQPGRPFGDEAWTEVVARRTGLGDTLRPRDRDRPRKQQGQQN